MVRKQCESPSSSSARLEQSGSWQQRGPSLSRQRLSSTTAQTTPSRRSVRSSLLSLAVLAGMGISSIAAASPKNPIVLVLGVSQEGQLVPRARSAMATHLLRMGETVLSPPLSSAELLCTETDCLHKLAKTYKADRLLGGELLPNDRNYIVRTWMLDLQTAQPSTTEDRCTECSAEQASEVIARAAGKLIDANLAPAATPAPAPPAPAPAAPAPSAPAQVELTMPPPPPAVPGSSAGDGLTAAGSAATAAPPHATCRPRFYSFGRGIAVGALSALALGSLVSGIGLLAADGSVYIPAGEQGFPGDVTHNFKPEYRAAFAAAALSAVGLGAAVTPWQRWVGHTDASASNLPLCPLPRGKWTFQRGAAIGALGGLLASSLVTSFVLTGLNGQSYVSDDPSVISMEVPYHYRSGAATGYGISAGLALGLSLAIIIP